MPRNQLALVSLWLSLFFPAALLLDAVTIGIVVQPTLEVFYLLTYALIPLSFMLDLLGVAALFAAIATGHRALGHARDYPPQQARRGLAIAGMVLGYVELVVLIGIAIWIYTHPFRMHMVY
jgi:hypothetical protein